MKTFVCMFALNYSYLFKEGRELPPAIQAKVDLLRAAADEDGWARLRGVGGRVVKYEAADIHGAVCMLSAPFDNEHAYEVEVINLYTPEWEKQCARGYAVRTP